MLVHTILPQMKDIVSSELTLVSSGEKRHEICQKLQYSCAGLQYRLSESQLSQCLLCCGYIIQKKTDRFKNSKNFECQ